MKCEDGDFRLRLEIYDPVDRDPRLGVFAYLPHAVYLLAGASRRDYLGDKKQVGCIVRPYLPVNGGACDIARHDKHVRLPYTCRCADVIWAARNVHLGSGLPGRIFEDVLEPVCCVVVPGAGGQLRQPPIGKFVALAVFGQRVKVIKGVRAIFVHRRDAHWSYLPPAQAPHGAPQGYAGTRQSVAATSLPATSLPETSGTVSSRASVDASVPAQAATAPGLLDALTEREREIVALVATGMSNAQIADRLTLSPLTVKTHANHAMSKFGARDRAQLVVLAYQAGRPGARVAGR